MTGLDSLTRAGLGGAISDPGVLSMVSKGLEAIQNLMAQGKTKDADAVLQFLDSLLGKRFSWDSNGIAEPEPFTAPQPSSLGGAPFSLPTSFTAPPSAPGSALLQGPFSSEDLNQRIEGLPQNLATALPKGSPEWTTVQCALQQHEDLHFDADSQRFFTTLSDGSKVDLCSVYDAEDVLRQNGGFSGGSTASDIAGAVGPLNDFIKDKIDEASRHPFAATNTLGILSGNPPYENPSRITMETFNTQIDALRRKLAEFDEARTVLEGYNRISRPVVG